MFSFAHILLHLLLHEVLFGVKLLHLLVVVTHFTIDHYLESIELLDQTSLARLHLGNLIVCVDSCIDKGVFQLLLHSRFYVGDCWACLQQLFVVLNLPEGVCLDVFEFQFSFCKALI